MIAAYASYWNPAQDTCAQYVLQAKQVCKAVAGGASKAGEALEHLYKTYGPEFGAIILLCGVGKMAAVRQNNSKMRAILIYF